MNKVPKQKIEKRTTEMTIAVFILLLTGAAVTASSSNILDAGTKNSDGLIAEYRFDTGTGDTAYDTGGKNDGTINGARWKDGLKGNALKFDGSNDEVNLKDQKKLKPKNNLTVSIWIRPTRKSGTQTILLVGRDVSSGYEIRRDRVKIEGNNGGSSTAINLDYNQWNHLALSYQRGSGGEVYINGRKTGTLSNQGKIVYPEMYGSSPTIGSHGGIYNFEGSLDDLKIYSKPMDQNQIKSIYNTGSWRIGTTTEEDDPSKVAEFSFQHQNSSHVLDTSGYNNHGERVNGVGQETSVGCKVGRCYSFDGNGDRLDISSDSIPEGDQVTISFWAYGGSEQPVENSVIEAEDSSNNRVVNIHLPWDNGNVYWDTANNDGNGYDRIYKSADPENYRGKWTHWTFTKKASAGTKKIYQNGQLWHSGTGYTKSLQDTETVSIGNYAGGGSRDWPGKLDEFKIYNRSLSQQEIIEKTQGLQGGGTVLDLRFNRDGGDRVNDYSGGKNHGTLQPNASAGPKRVDGLTGNALEFDGKSDYIGIPYDSSFDFNYKDSFTLSAWIYPDKTNDEMIVDTEGWTENYALRIKDGLELWLAARDGCSINAGDIISNKWQYVVATYSNESVEMYIDGEKVKNTTCTYNFDGGNRDLSIGSYYPSGGYNSHSFDGKIDSVKIHPYRLSNSKIQQLYSRGKSQVGSSKSSSSTNLQDGLVLSQTFDRIETCGQSDTVSCPSGMSGKVAVDESGKGFHGEMNGPNEEGAEDCRGGGCLGFDGVDDFVNAEKGKSLQIDQDVTVGAWVKTDTVSDLKMIVDDYRSSYGGGDHGYMLLLRSNGAAAFEGRDGSGTYYSSGESAEIDDNKWRYLVGQKEGSVWKIYVDGELASKSDVGTSGSIDANTTDLVIGADQGGSQYQLEGSIDQVRVYNRSLSENEIWELYTKGRDLSSEGEMPGPVAHWGFDEEKNLMNNSGFEIDEVNDNDPTYWTYPKENAWNISKDYTAPGSDGQKSFGNQWQQRPDVWPDAYVYSNFSAKPNTNYNAEFWVRLQVYSDGGWTGTKSNQQYIYEDDARLHLYFYDESGNLLQENKTRWAGDAYNRGLDYIEKSGDWFKFSQNYTSPAKTDQVRFQIDGGDNNNDYGDPETAHGGNAGIWMDDISFSFAGAYDKSEDNKGVIKGASRVNGVTGNALDFDGNDDFVDTGISDNIQTDSFSVSTWMNPDTLSSGGKRLINKDPSINGWSLSYGDPGSGKLRFFIRGKDTTSLDTAQVIEKDRWYHVTAVYDDQDKTRKIYVNGVEEASLGSDTGSPSTNSNNIALGAEADNQNNFDGTLDDARIYPYALNKEQVKRVMNAGAVSVG